MVKKLKEMAEKKAPTAAGRSTASWPAPSRNRPSRSGWPAWARSPRRRKKAARSSRPWSRKASSLQRKTQARGRREDQRGHQQDERDGRRRHRQGRPAWDKLESIFEERVAKALSKLGVPSRQGLDALIKRIDELSAKLAKQPKASAKAAGPRAATKRPVRKTTL